MKEACCQFGPGQRLAGVVTEPAGSARAAAVVLVSAGVTPKLGPFRLYAELARRLASDGFRTLRFDLGGIGDSGHAFEDHTLERRSQLQIGAALDYLGERFGPDGIVLGGLCSGAEDSFRHAERDSRVTGVVMIDPFAYRTPGFWLRQPPIRVKRRLLRALGLFRPLEAPGTASLVDYQYLPRAEASRILRTLLARQVRLHFIYTGGMGQRFNHASQLQAMFRGIDFDALVRLDHLPHLDHTQPFQADRRLLIETISRRLLARGA